MFKVGQITNKNRKNYEKSDYLQLDICGCSLEESILKYKEFNIDKPIILHGDWSKRGFSENNIISRQKDYIEIINYFKSKDILLGFTIHPPYRNKINIYDFLSIIDNIKEESSFGNIFIENRSNSKINISLPEEVIELSNKYKMTIDIPQLYISCKYDIDFLINILKKINIKNIKELHLANVLKTEKNTFVGRQLDDGLLKLEYILPYFKDTFYITLEILGGENSFNRSIYILNNIKEGV